MKIFPAIDLYGGKAVRLFKGDYSKMTVYSENPLEVARDFEQKGAEFIHLVDLEGAKDGTTPNFETVKSIAENTRLFTEIGGGIRSMETVEKYLGAGVDRGLRGRPRRQVHGIGSGGGGQEQQQRQSYRNKSFFHLFIHVLSASK